MHTDAAGCFDTPLKSEKKDDFHFNKVRIINYF